MIPYYEAIEHTHVGNRSVLKEMLFIFAAYDVYLVALHAIVKQRVIVVDTTIFGSAAEWNSRFVSAFFASCNTVPFVLMIIDFLYRYWCIARPHLIPLFSNWKFILFLVLITLAEFILWFLVCTYLMSGEEPSIARTLLAEEYERRVGHEMREGWLIYNYWEDGEMHMRYFIGLMIFDAIMVVSVTVAITLGGLCYYHIYFLGGHSSISAHSLAMQRKLFVSLSAQTAVPLFFVYIPYICVLNLPFFKLPVFFWNDACMLLTTCFPAWDGILVIVLMPDYWKGLINMLSMKKKTGPKVSGPTTTSVSNSRRK